MRHYFVYVLASHSRRFYVGVTNDLGRRVHEHKTGIFRGHTWRYRVVRLVHFEETNDVRAAIAREKQLKRWTRSRKIRLIEQGNPAWLDLAASWEPRPGR